MRTQQPQPHPPHFTPPTGIPCPTSAGIQVPKHCGTVSSAPKSAETLQPAQPERRPCALPSCRGTAKTLHPPPDRAAASPRGPGRHDCPLLRSVTYSFFNGISLSVPSLRSHPYKLESHRYISVGWGCHLGMNSAQRSQTAQCSAQPCCSG